MPGRAKAIMGTTKCGGYRRIISRNLGVPGVERETDLTQEPSLEGFQWVLPYIRMVNSLLLRLFFEASTSVLHSMTGRRQLTLQMTVRKFGPDKMRCRRLSVKLNEGQISASRVDGQGPEKNKPQS